MAVTEKKLLLNFAWGIRLKLRAEGNKLRAEGDKLRAEGDRLCAEGNKLRAEGDKLWAEWNRLWAEGDKLRAEGNKLRAEGDKLWAEAILEACGNINLFWTYKNKKEICELETGETFERDKTAKI